MRSTAKIPYLTDVAVNLTDCVFRGVDYKGNRVHEDDFEQVLRRAEAHNVQQIIITGTNLAQCEKAIALCRRYPDHRLLCTVGVHPAHCAEFLLPYSRAVIDAVVADDLSVVEPHPPPAADTQGASEEHQNAAARLARLVELVEANRDIVVAVGEIGMDYAELASCPREVQAKYFVEQLHTFAGLQLPFLFHSRDCGMEFVKLLEQSRHPAVADLHGVVHSFNGCQEEQDWLLGQGLYLSLNGSAFRTREMAAQAVMIPLDRLLLETDAPWCDIRKKDYGYTFVKTHFPTAKRRKGTLVLGDQCLERRNEPCHLPQVLESYLGCRAQLAAGEERAVLSADELVAVLFDNCKNAFRLDRAT